LRDGLELLKPAPFRLTGDVRSETRRLLELALELQGARLASEGNGRAHGVLVPVSALDGLSPAELAAFSDATRGAPLFLFCEERDTPQAVDPANLFRALTGVPLRPLAAARVRRYRFADDPDVWPFCGLTLEERNTRLLPAVAADVPAVHPLLFSEHGCILLRWSSGDRTVFLALPPLAAAGPRVLLKREFCPEQFVGLLPLLTYIRAALAGYGWRPPHPRAALLVDDPNLRLARYGFLDLRRLLEAASRHDFHVGVAMIPIDYRKTGQAAANLVRNNPKRLSLVLHGVDHLKREFEADVSPERARCVLEQGLKRMDAHRRATGIDCAHAMTFPHGVCNPTWMAAMREVGLDAAIASRARPFASDDAIDNPLYELYPAEMTFLGFPVVNRFKAEDPKEHLLFAAWLGKPVIVYTHHGFFRDGVGGAVELAKFLNRHVQPEWTDVGAILRSNYQIRRLGDAAAVRVFSNRISLSAENASPVAAVVKPGRDLPPDERAQRDGAPLDVEVLPGVGLVASALDSGQDRIELRFGPVRYHATTEGLRIAPRSRLRRLATELRDQIAPTLLLATRGRAHSRLD
jgi:hypothetical protein